MSGVSGVSGVFGASLGLLFGLEGVIGLSGVGVGSGSGSGVGSGTGSGVGSGVGVGSTGVVFGTVGSVCFTGAISKIRKGIATIVTTSAAAPCQDFLVLPDFLIR